MEPNEKKLDILDNGIRYATISTGKSRPSDSISPKRELQSLIFGSGARYSPRRPWMGLSDLVSHSGERHSPKRGREETWIVLSAKPHPGEEFCGFKRTRVSLRRDGLA